MKLLVLFLLFLPLTYSFGQERFFVVGFETNTNFWRHPFNQAMLKTEVISSNKSWAVGTSFGGFFVNENPEEGTWRGGLFTFGLNAAGYFRGGKKYQPGIQILGQTMFHPPNKGTSVFNHFYEGDLIEDARFRNIPVTFCTRFTQLFWNNGVGLEFGIGYRYYLVHYQSEVLANFYRPKNSIEFSFGAKFLINRKKN